LPQFSDDDVLDFMVTEAVVVHAAAEEQHEREKAEKKAKREAWRADHRKVGRAGG
jgi:hypothetical protein